MTDGKAKLDGSVGSGPRALVAEDLEQVLAIDTETSGRSRRGFFENRLAAALRDPGDFIYVGIADGPNLQGYAMARILEGEFGETEPIAVLDAIGVRGARQGKGIGQQLLDRIDTVMRAKGISEMRTEVVWPESALLTFFGAAGFKLAPRMVLELPLAETALD